MFILNNRKINIDSQLTIGGTTYPNLRDPALREALGVTEVPDPVYPDPLTHYWIELENGELVITPKSDEQLKQQADAKVKAEIAALEAGQARAVREAALGNPTFLQEIDAKIVALRAKL